MTENKNHFADDEEKRDDFLILDKEDFLQSYSYLTEKEYENTRKELKNRGYKFKLYDGQGGEFMMTRMYKNKNQIRTDFFEFARTEDIFEDSDLRNITLDECLEVWTMELKEI